MRKAWVFVFAKMYLVQDKGGAIALMIAALCFLGTWPALLNLVERQGRNLMHTYLDYSITNYLVAIIFAFTLGQIGSSTPESPNFLTQLHQVNNFWCLRHCTKTKRFASISRTQLWRTRPTRLYPCHSILRTHELNPASEVGEQWTPQKIWTTCNCSHQNLQISKEVVEWWYSPEVEEMRL